MRVGAADAGTAGRGTGGLIFSPFWLLLLECQWFSLNLNCGVLDSLLKKNQFMHCFFLQLRWNQTYIHPNILFAFYFHLTYKNFQFMNYLNVVSIICAMKHRLQNELDPWKRNLPIYDSFAVDFWIDSLIHGCWIIGTLSLTFTFRFRLKLEVECGKWG